MKKKLLIVAAIAFASTSFAQDLTSKKGETMLPEAEDWSIGFDAAPWLTYAGQFLGASNTSPTAQFTTPDFSITGKYFVDANTAYRARVRIGMGSGSATSLVDTSLASQGGTGYQQYQGSYIENVSKTSYRQVTLGGGIEKRRGNTRVQGVYGGELLISMGGSKSSNEYEVAMDSVSVKYTDGSGTGAVEQGRVLENKNGSTFGVTVRGFIGVEIFVFPKVSIGAEYGWGLGFSSTGEGETTREYNGFATNTATGRTTFTEVTRTGGSSGFGIDTDNSGGQLNINFYF